MATSSTDKTIGQLEIKNVDMTDEMKDMAINVTKQAMEKYKLEREIASFIKKQFDEMFGKYWHVIVGKSFGSMVCYWKL